MADRLNAKAYSLWSAQAKDVGHQNLTTGFQVAPLRMRHDTYVSEDELILEIIEGSSSGRQIPISGQLELGRDPSLEAALDDDQVSRRHARLAPSAGRVLIEDLGSLNGTYVDGRLVQGPEELTEGGPRRGRADDARAEDTGAGDRPRSAVEPAPEMTVRAGTCSRWCLRRSLRRCGPRRRVSPASSPRRASPLSFSAAPAAASRRKAGGAGDDLEAVARLLDVRVKHRSNVAAFVS